MKTNIKDSIRKINLSITFLTASADAEWHKTRNILTNQNSGLQ